MYYQAEVNESRHFRCSDSYTPARTQTHALTHAQTHTHTQTHTHKCTHARRRRRSLAHSHTHTYTHIQTHKHTHLHTHINVSHGQLRMTELKIFKFKIPGIQILIPGNTFTKGSNPIKSAHSDPTPFLFGTVFWPLTHERRRECES